MKYNLTEKSSPKAPAIKDVIVKNTTSKQTNVPTSSGQKGQEESPGNAVPPELSESRLDLMERAERLRLRLAKREKQEKLHKQKINKLMFFFFTL